VVAVGSTVLHQLFVDLVGALKTRVVHPLVGQVVCICIFLDVHDVIQGLKEILVIL